MIKIEGAEKFVAEQNSKDELLLKKLKRTDKRNEIVARLSWICVLLSLLVLGFMPQHLNEAKILVAVSFFLLLMGKNRNRKIEEDFDVKDIVLLNSMIEKSDNGIRFFMDGNYRSYLYLVDTFSGKDLRMLSVPFRIDGVNDDDELSIARPDENGKILLTISRRLDKEVKEKFGDIFEPRLQDVLYAQNTFNTKK